MREGVLPALILAPGPRMATGWKETSVRQVLGSGLPSIQGRRGLCGVSSLAVANVALRISCQGCNKMEPIAFPQHTLFFPGYPTLQIWQ